MGKKEEKYNERKGERAKHKKNVANQCNGETTDAEKGSTGNANRRYLKQLKRKVASAKSQGEPEVTRGMPSFSRIKVGSDCSGYGSDTIALTLLGLEPEVVFCADSCPMKRELLAVCHKSCGMPWPLCYNDIGLRDNASAPYVDIFLTGAPCQAYSGAGKRLALGDPRGVVIMYSMDYVREKRPRVVVIENVRGMIQGDLRVQIWEPIRTMLLDLGYVVHSEVIDTKKHGIPQSRPRFYVVAVRQSCVEVPFEYPRPTSSASLARFLDLDNVGVGHDVPDGRLVSTCHEESFGQTRPKNYG